MAYFYGYHHVARASRNGSWQGNSIGFRDFIAISLGFWAFIFAIVFLGVMLQSKTEPSANDVFIVTKVDKKQRELKNLQNGDKLTVYDVKLDNNVKVGWLVMYNPDTKNYDEVQMSEVVECLKERE